MKDRLKDFFYRRIANLGAFLTPHSYASGLEMASHFRELFAKLRITCVFDVGANEGQYRNFLRRRCGYTGEILSFEPAQKAFAVLQNRAAGDPAWAFIIMLSVQRTAEKVLNTMADTRFSSFLNPQTSGCSYIDSEECPGSLRNRDGSPPGRVDEWDGFPP